MWSLWVEFLPADLSDLPSSIEDTLNLYTSELSIAWMIWTQANCPVLPTAGMFWWEGSADKGGPRCKLNDTGAGATMFSLLSLSTWRDLTQPLTAKEKSWRALELKSTLGREEGDGRGKEGLAVRANASVMTEGGELKTSPEFFPFPLLSFVLQAAIYFLKVCIKRTKTTVTIGKSNVCAVCPRMMPWLF